MKIIEFNVHQGVYNFELKDLTTELHSHPVIEIAVAMDGFFSIETIDNKFDNITFVVIDSNVKHKLIAKNCNIKLLMFESYNSIYYDLLGELEITFKNGVFTKDDACGNMDLYDKLEIISKNRRLKNVEDKRIKKCLEIFADKNIDYKEMMDELTSIVHLSESRLSHLFKLNIGISLKKYLVWCKLKYTMHLMLKENLSLVEASFRSGFYDQAHLSNTFKRTFGINPSKEYNSRIIQL